MLESLTVFVMGLLALGLARLVRRRLPWDVPLILGVAGLLGAGGHGLWLGLEGEGWQAACLIGALWLGQVPPVLDWAAMVARVRGRWDLGTLWSGLAMVCAPSARQRTLVTIHRTVWRARRGQLPEEEAMARLHALGPRLSRFRDAAVRMSFREAVTAVFRGPDRWDRIAARYDPKMMAWYAHPPNGGGVAAVEALGRAGRHSEAGALLHAMETVAGQGRLVPAESDLALDRARLVFVAILGRREDITRLLDRDSSVAALFPTWRRRELLAWAGQVDVEPLPADARAMGDAAVRKLRRSARLPNSVSHFGRPAPMTLGIAVALVVVYGVLSLLGLQDHGTDYVRWGAAAPELRGPEHWWRLFGSTTLHSFWLHVGLNAVALLFFGNQAERLVGRTRFLLAYLLSGLGGTWLHVMLGGEGIVVGASGAVFGVFGVAMAAMWVQRSQLPPTWYRRHILVYAVLLGLNLAVSLAAPFISLPAHAGGFLVGLVVTAGLLMLPRPQPAVRWIGRVVVVGLWAGVIAVWGWGLAGSLQVPAAEAMPLVSTAYEVVSLDDGVRAEVQVDRPVAWRRDPRLEDPAVGPRIAGPQRSLAETIVRCRSQLDPGEAALAPRDADGLLAWLAEVMGAEGRGFDGGPDGFVWRWDGPFHEVHVLTAYRVEELGSLIVRFYLRGSRLEEGAALARRVVSNARILRCDATP